MSRAGQSTARGIATWFSTRGIGAERATPQKQLPLPPLGAASDHVSARRLRLPRPPRHGRRCPALPLLPTHRSCGRRGATGIPATAAQPANRAEVKQPAGNLFADRATFKWGGLPHRRLSDLALPWLLGAAAKSVTKGEDTKSHTLPWGGLSRQKLIRRESVAGSLPRCPDDTNCTRGRKSSQRRQGRELP